MVLLDKGNYYLYQAAIGLFAVLFLIGRWDPLRRLGFPNEIIFEARLWLLIVSCFIVGIILFQVKKVKDTDVSVLMGLIGLFFAYMIVTPLWSPEPGISGYKVYELLTVFFMLGGLYFLFKIRDFRENFWFYSMIITGVLAGIGIFNILLAGPGGKLAVLGGGPIIYARFMGILCLVALHRAFARDELVKWLTVAAIATVLLFLTGARGPFLSLIVAAGFLMYYWRDKWKFNFKLVALVLLLVVIISLSPIWDQLVSFIQDRIIGQTFIDRYGAGRMNLYFAALDLIKERPILGWGLNYYHVPQFTRHVYPHNIFLEIGVDGGLIGIFLFLLILGWGAITIFNRKGALDILSLSLFVFLLISSQFSGDFYDNRGVLFLLLMAVFPLKGYLMGKKPSREKKIA